VIPHFTELRWRCWLLQVSRWSMDGNPSTTPPPLMPTSSFNHGGGTVAVQSAAVHHLNRAMSLSAVAGATSAAASAPDNSPPLAPVACQSPHSVSGGGGFSSTGHHIPFYPWMGVVGTSALVLENGSDVKSSRPSGHFSTHLCSLVVTHCRCYSAINHAQNMQAKDTIWNSCQVCRRAGASYRANNFFFWYSVQYLVQ